MSVTTPSTAKRIAKVQLYGVEPSFDNSVETWMLEKGFTADPDISLVTSGTALTLEASIDRIEAIVEALPSLDDLKEAIAPLPGTSLPGRIIKGKQYVSHDNAISQGAPLSVPLGAFPKTRSPEA